jgi:hypothetical protein
MMADLSLIVDSIRQLPGEWHTSGSVHKEVLSAIAHLVEKRTINHSVETGSGKTTLLLSHISTDHTVFAIDGGTNSISAVRSSPILRPGVVNYVEGPTQQTLPRYSFKAKLQLALLDGPHAYPFPELEYYFIYPHLEPGALLIIDDIQIPTIRRMFDFLVEDEMFDLLEIVWDTAFLVRTGSPTFDPYGDGWTQQAFNKKRFPIESLPRKARRLARAAKHGVRRVLNNA